MLKLINYKFYNSKTISAIVKKLLYLKRKNLKLCFSNQQNIKNIKSGNPGSVNPEKCLF